MNAKDYLCMFSLVVHYNLYIACEPVLEYEDTKLANIGVHEHKNWSIQY